MQKLETTTITMHTHKHIIQLPVTTTTMTHHAATATPNMKKVNALPMVHNVHTAKNQTILKLHATRNDNNTAQNVKKDSRTNNNNKTV